MFDRSGESKLGRQIRVSQTSQTKGQKDTGVFYIPGPSYERREVCEWEQGGTKHAAVADPTADRKVGVWTSMRFKVDGYMSRR